MEDIKQEEEIKKFVNKLAMQLNPSNDTMKAIRLLRKELPELLAEQNRISKESVKEKIERIKKERLTIPKSPLDITPREQMQQSVQPIYRGYKSNEESHNQALDLAINILEE